jgi:hypothetical protein
LSNKKELEITENVFSTNPSYIKSNFNSSISIYSGQKIPDTIKCYLYDDYNNVLHFQEDLEDTNLNDLIIFEIEMNNTYNTKIYGQTYSYCWDDVCSIPSVEILANPGNYKLIFQILTFGEYIEFSQSKIEFDLEILECPENYLNQAINESNIKICYEPKCDKGCNGGKCIKNNVCKCTSTFFKGKYCNEYYKLERIRGMDIAIRVVLLILIIISVMLIVLLLIYRKRPEIKGGNKKK